MECRYVTRGGVGGGNGEEGDNKAAASQMSESLLECIEVTKARTMVVCVVLVLLLLGWSPS